MDSIRLAEFVGLPSALGWSHVATISASSGARSIICFAVSGSEASAIGHEVVAILRSSQIESEQALYDLVISLNAKTQERSSRLSIAAGFMEKNHGAWITIDGVVGLQRNDRFGRVLSSVDLQMRAGAIRPGDMFVLTTSAASGMLDDIDELFQQGYQPIGVESSLERLIRTQPQQDQSALALIEVLPVSSQPEPIEEQSAAPLQTLEDIAVVQITPASVTDEADNDLTDVEIHSVDDNDHTKVAALMQPPEQVVPAQVPPKASSNRTKQISVALGAVLGSVAAGGKRLSSQVRPLIHRVGTSFSQLSILLVSSSRRTYAVLKRTLRQMPWRSWRDSKRVRVIVAGIVVLILLVITMVSTIGWQQRQSAAVATEAVAPFRAQLVTVQQQAASNPVQAQASLTELAKAVSEKITSTTPKPVATGLQSFLEEIRQYEDVLKGEQAIRSLPVVMDLQTVVPGFVATMADGLSGNGFYVDLSKKIGILVNFKTQETRQFDLGTIETIKAISLRSQTNAVILGDGIYSLDLTKTAPPVLEKPLGDSNRGATLIGSYTNYVYIFNPEKRNIFRYLIRKDGYSDPIGWLLSPLGIPADSVSAMKVDGDVWLGTKDGQIKKFTSGRSTSFAPSNLEQPLEGPVQPYTSETEQYLYVFVPAQQRVVVLTKEGVFVKQIKSEILSGALAVVADEVAGLLYAVSGSIIYQAAL